MKTHKNPVSDQLHGFVSFIREQGVVGLAVGFILGGAVSKVVASIVSDVVDPILGLILGSVDGLKGAVIPFFGAKIMIGNFLSTVLDFVVIAAVVYFVVKGLGLDKADKKK